MRKPRLSSPEAQKPIKKPRKSEKWIPAESVRNNRDVCYNPPKHLDHNCPECWFYEWCSCLIKDDYRKRHAKVTERETLSSTTLMIEQPKKKPRRPEVPSVTPVRKPR